MSRHSENYILKGALMLLAWDLPVTRPTRDIDMLARAPNDTRIICQVMNDICGTDVDDDGLVSYSDGITTERIAEDALYEGIRSTFKGFLGNARIAMQIDLGFSDVVTPHPVDLIYPTLLDQPAPMLKAYNHETAIAEKFETMVKLGELNSRMKDFFDIWSMTRGRTYDGSTLISAVGQTFARRNTKLSSDAFCFREEFGNLADKQKQWLAFVRRSQLEGRAPESFVEVWREVMRFLKPLVDQPDLCTEWNPIGRWDA